MRHSTLLILACVLMALSSSASQDKGNQPGGQKAELPADGQKLSKNLILGAYTTVELVATFHKENEQVPIIAFECTRPCQGKKHKKHAECDDSCDGKCPTVGNTHRRYIRIESSELGDKGNTPPAQSHSTTLNDVMTKWGGAGNISSESILGEYPFAKFELFSGINLTGLSVSSDHWNKTPCSNSAKVIKGQKYTVDLEYQFIDKGDTGKERNLGPKGTLRYMVIIPIPGSDTNTDPIVSCKCEQTQTAPTDGEQPGHGFIPGRTPTGGDYAWVEQNNMRRPITGGDIGHLVSTISVPNMNEAFLTPNTMPWGPAHFPAGWELECIDGSGQDVQLQEDFEVPYLSPGLIYEWPQEDAKRIRALCLEIHKPEPREGMKFRLAPPRTAAIARLAQITKNSRFRGPWDQVRLWIATDKASFDEMAKVLIPMPGMGTYLRQMFLAAGVGAISTDDPKIRANMENRFLLAENFDPDAVSWMLDEKLRIDPASLIRWLRGQKTGIAGLFNEGQAKDDLELIGILASGLAGRGGGDGISAAIWLLSEAVPQAHRTALLSGNAGRVVASALLLTQDEKTATAILDWIEATKPAGAKFACLNANEKLPDAIKERANKLAMSLP